MSKKITDEEKKVFRDAMADVRPLKKSAQEKIISEKMPEIPEKKITRTKIKIHEDFSDPTFFTVDEKQPDISGTDIISFSRPGVQRKQFSQLSRGKIHPEATLDLHDHTSDEAITAVEHFLNRCQKNSLRMVCIIHGKGLYSSGNKPVLKNLLNSFLRQHPMVLAFHSAKNNQGGTGAIVVLIKSKSNHVLPQYVMR